MLLSVTYWSSNSLACHMKPVRMIWTLPTFSSSFSIIQPFVPYGTEILNNSSFYTVLFHDSWPHICCWIQSAWQIPTYTLKLSPVSLSCGGSLDWFLCLYKKTCPLLGSFSYFLTQVVEDLYIFSVPALESATSPKNWFLLFKNGI